MRFRLPGTRRGIEQDVEDELAFHLDQRAAELERAGLSPAAARAEAERRFGGVSGARRQLATIDRRRERGQRRAEWWEGIVHDVRYALRGLRRQPGFAAAVVLALGFGLGATAAMFGIVDRLLLRPPAHVRAPEDVGRLYFTETFSWAGVVTQESTSYPDFVTLRDHTRAVRQVAAYFPRALSVGRGRDAQQVRSIAASGAYFPLLGVRPVLGRFFGPAEDALPTGQRVAVISDGFWRRRFGADSSVLGRTIELDQTAFTVIGVAPAGFTGVGLNAVDVWVPLSTVGAHTIGEGWEHFGGWRWIRLLARRTPGYTREQANAEMTTIYRAALQERGHPDSTATVTVGSIIAARGPHDGGSGVSEARISLWLGGVAVFVLLIACANAVNLLLARAVRRRREIGVRLALGVSRGRLVRQLLVEGLLLAVLGGVAGLTIARWGGGVLRALLLPGVSWHESLFDTRLLGLAGGLVLLVAMVTGLAPAAHALSQNLIGSVKAGAREGPSGRSRVRQGLVLLQATLSVVLLVGAGLFVRSLRNVRGIPLGFDASRVLLVDLNLTDADAETRDALFQQARDRVARLPVVERASVALSAPFWSSFSTGLRVPGLDSLPTSQDGGPYVNAVTPEFFATMGTPILRGRGFSEADGRSAPRVAIVSETFARMVWPREDAIGKCLILGSDTAACSTVVGIAADARRQSLTGDAPVMQYYTPLAQEQSPGVMRVLFVRVRGDLDKALVAVRRETQSVSADLPYPTVRYLADLVEPEIRPWKLGATLFSIFGAVALALAALGLYSVVAYSVAQRVHEMGVRVALGARGGDLARLVVRQTLWVVAVGLAVGLVAAVIAGRWAQPLLFHVSPRDPVVLGAVTGTLLLVGVLASLAPARRAARVSPAEVLKAE